MTRILKIAAPFLILVAGVVATVVMIKSRSPVPTRPPQEYAPVVRVVEVEPKPHRMTVTTHGTVRPRTETVLVSEVAGRVMSTTPDFASGGYFEAGDVMLRIDPRDYELAVVTAKGLVAQARVRAETEQAQAEVAREEWKNLGGDRESPLATREPQLQEAMAALEAAEASLEVARRNLNRTAVQAPFACRVRKKMADVGQYVTPGTPVANIFAIDYVEITLPIADSELAYLELPFNYRGERADATGPEVLLHANFAGKYREWPGHIVRVEGEIDPVSRVVQVVAQVEDPYGRKTDGASMPLAVGLFVEADISGREIENAVVLPRSAVRDGNTVLIVDDDNRVRFREVDVLRMNGEEAIIGKGLDRGDKVCISTLEAVTEGMKIRSILESGETPSGPENEIGDEKTSMESGGAR